MLEAAIDNLKTQPLTVAQQQQTQTIAHRLIGSLSAYGLSDAALLARQIERSLKNTQKNTQSDCQATTAPQLAALLQQLQQASALSPFADTPATTFQPPLTHRILAMIPDPLLLSYLQIEAPNWSFHLDTATNLNSVRQLLVTQTPDAIILDLDCADNRAAGLDCLAQIKGLGFAPVLVLTQQYMSSASPVEALRERIALVHRGADACLQKPASPSDIFRVIARLLPRLDPITAKLLVVDDDPCLLAQLRQKLQLWGFQVIGLNDPSQFWFVLQATRPDLLLLDVAISEYSGIDLCRVVRCDAHWSELPILFLSAHAEASVLQQALSVGADDYVLKPIAETDLIQRILQRLGRISAKTPIHSRDKEREIYAS